MALAVAARDSGDPPESPRAPADTQLEPVAPPAPPPAVPLATGLSERNANLLRADPGPAEFEPWRARVEALRPRFYRLMVDWSQIQSDPGRPPAFDQADDGCLRDRPPCARFAGMRDVLRAVRAQQQENGGWEVVVAIYGVPEWAARRPHGCERSTELPRSRPFGPAGLEGYRALVRDLLRLAEAERVELKWWSPWNEPNHPYFISPQRARCDPRAPSVAARTYTAIARALQDELRRAGGDRRLVLGEMAAADEPEKLLTAVTEMVEALPDDVACAGDVWAQHEYAERALDRERGDPVAQLRRALDARECTRDKRIWVTETGVGGRRVGARRTLSAREQRVDCRAMAASLRRWADDERVDAAFQFSFREDTAFPVGLVDSGLTRVYTVYELWKDWADGEGSARACGG
ncbi:MAG TPA: hypothetical protein VGW10_12900 [Solirubrobacteraceae bacterium]|nr:hypothetical protein [Solirubrobacteraceae bacterium]